MSLSYLLSEIAINREGFLGCSDIYEIVHNSQKLFDKSFPGRIKAENPKLKLLSRI